MGNPPVSGSGFQFGQSVPPLPDPLIERDNILDTIDQVFDSGHDVLILEGPEGNGKTVTSSMFARRHSASTFTLFLRGGSRWGYDAPIHREDLCHQFAAALRKPIRDDAAPSEATFRSLVYSLRRWVRAAKGRAYFVVDGLTEVPNAGWESAREILDFLPFDVQGLKFLITKDSQSKIELSFPKTAKSTVLTVLSLTESSRFLAAFGVQPPDHEQIHRTCLGRPDRLAAVGRLVMSGVSPKEIAGTIDKAAPSLFGIEWDRAEIQNPICRLALALVAYSNTVCGIDDLCRLTGASQDALREQFAKLSFTEVDGEGRVAFVSEPFRRYAAERLTDLRKKVDDVVINDLFSRREDKNAAAMLPGVLHQAGRYDQLLQYLTPGHFEAAVKINQSVTPIKRQIDFGVQAALASGRDGELLRFSIHKSTLMQLESVDVWKAEVEARIALDDFATAESLANAVHLKEDRLHLLAVIAKAKLTRGLTPTSELLETIRSLYCQIDHKQLGERALEIAADLVYCAPSFAVEMVEEASGPEPGEADVAIATLALATRKDVLPRVDGDVAKTLRDRIRSPHLRAFIEETQVKTRDTTAQDILAQVLQVTQPQRKMFFLRQWAVQNRRREDAWEVVEAGLDLAIRSTEYTPNARDMRELASPLPFIEPAERLRRLTGKFSANRGNIEGHGPTVDYVRLLLLLAHGEYRHDATIGAPAFCEAYLYTTDIHDLGIRAECCARLIVALDTADPSRNLETTDKLHSLAEKGLMDAVVALREATALHDTVFSGVLHALAGSRVGLAADIALSLNTEPRRDEALVEVVTSAFRASESPVGFIKAREVIDKIKSAEERDEATFKVLDRARRRKELPASWSTEVCQFLNLAQSVSDPEIRVRCFARIYCVLKRSDPSGSSAICDTVFNSTERSLAEIDVGWEKVRAAFEASSLLAPFAAPHARRLLALAETAKQNALLQTGNAAEAYIGTIFLAFTAFAGLLGRHLTDENDLCRLADLIDRVPSYGERARIWAELALRVHAAKEHALCQTIVSQRVRPLLEKVRTEFPSQLPTALAAVLPALYSAYPLPALGEFASLPAEKKDVTLYRAYASPFL